LIASTQTELVGREEELAALEAFLDGLESSGPAGLVVEGEAGIGKTTLWTEGLRAAERRGCTVLSASGSPGETQLSFAAIGDLLGDLAAVVLPGLPGPQRQALEVVLLLAGPRDRPPDERAIGTAVLTAFRQLAATTTLLVAIDDVQWLDEPSLRALEFAARRLKGERVGLLVARRGTDSGALPLALDRASFPSTRVALQPMSLGALHQLLRARLGRTYSRPVIRRIHDLSGGNAFFALEVGRAAPSHSANPDDLTLPMSLEQAAATRIGSLPPAALTALAVVALAAEPTVELVETSAGNREGLEAALSESVLEQVGGRLRFAHPLLAAASVQRTSPDERRALHRILADVVTDEEERALHRAEATEQQDEEAAAALEAAAAAARRRGATSRAATLLEHALRLTKDDSAAARLTLAAADAHFHGSDPARGITLLEGIVDSLPRGPVRARALWQLAIAVGEVSGAGHELALHQEALREVGDDVALRARILRRLARTAFYVGEIDLASTSMDTALELAERTGEPGLIADALSGVVWLGLLTEGVVDERLLERALALEQQDSELPLDDSPSANYAFALLQRFRVGEARTIFLELHRRAVDRGDETNASAALFFLAVLEILAGDLDAAERYADEGLEVAEQTDVNRVALLIASARVAAFRGRVDDAHRLADDALARAESFGERVFVLSALAVKGFAELSAGRAAEAQPILQAASDEADAVAGQGAWFARFRLDLIEALIGLGRLDDAQRVLDQFERASAAGETWPAALAAYGRGLLLGAKGQAEAAAEELEAALRQFEPYAVPFERARMLLALGVVRRRARHRAAARQALEEACATFDRIGTPLWAERARAELARIGGRTASPDELTPTESRVASLVSRGKTNKEVAAELVVSVRAVEANLSRIYSKLGVRSRAELARHYATEEDRPT